jgi:shikimate kinase
MTDVKRPEIRLVVVIGPIASGKSTVSGHLTGRLLAAGLTVVCSDVDDVAAMIHAPGGRTTEHWEQAHRVHGALVRGWLDSPADLVIAQGPIYTRSETDSLMGGVPSRTRVLRVLLLASMQSALQRVAGNPDRGLSKEPNFLRAAYERFRSVGSAIDSCDLTFDTNRDSAELIASRIADELLEASGRLR